MAILGKDFLKTPQQREEENRQYFRRVFPMGEAQKEWEDRIFAQVFPDREKELPGLRFIGFLTKDLLLDGADRDENGRPFKQYKRMIRRMRIRPEDLAVVRRIIEAELAAACLEDLPGPEAFL